MTLQSLKETIEKLDREATPGPWEAEINERESKRLDGRPDILVEINAGGIAIADLCGRKLGVTEDHWRSIVASGELIAYARTALPALLALAEDLQARLTEANQVIIDVMSLSNEMDERQKARLKVAEDALEQADLSLRAIHATTDLDAARIRAYDGLKHSTAALAEIRKDLNVSTGGVTKDEVL